jgi:hypothetical protein
MGSLEDKVARLSPEQRREVENFIDFVAQKKSSAGESLTAREGQVPPVMYAEERPVTAPPAVPDSLPSLADLRMHDSSAGKKDIPARPERSKGKDPGLLLDWID